MWRPEGKGKSSWMDGMVQGSSGSSAVKSSGALGQVRALCGNASAENEAV